MLSAAGQWCERIMREHGLGWGSRLPRGMLRAEEQTHSSHEGQHERRDREQQSETRISQDTDPGWKFVSANYVNEKDVLTKSDVKHHNSFHPQAVQRLV